MKALVVKNKDRRGKFLEIGSPPQPIVTRWGSWLNTAKYYAENFPKVCDIVNAFEGTGHLVVNAKAAVAAETFPNSLKEIYQCYMKLVEEIKRAESVKYTVSQAYKKGYKLDFGSDPVGVQLYLNHRLELNSDLKAIVNMSNTNVIPALYAKLLHAV